MAYSNDRSLNEEQRLANEHVTPSPNRSNKRQKLSTPATDAPDPAGKVRQSKTCSNCRKLKIRCDTVDNGARSCTRCSRLGLSCLRQTKSWARADEDNALWQTQLTITKLERALEDVLEKLDMPALDLYVSPAIVEPQHPPQPTRQNSEEPTPMGTNERDVSPDPMNSLIEATQLNGMRSQLRSVKLRRKGGMRRMDSDLIAEKLMSLQEAEEMLALFKQSQSHHLFSAGISPDATLDSIRASSTVLFTAIVLVTSLHIPGKETFHETCHSRFSGLVASVMFDRFHTLDDIRGLCIAAFWEPHLSWKLSGLSIRMATELNLHHAFYEVFNEPNMSSEARKECLEKSRLWYLLYILDHQSSVTYGRPPVMSDELRPIQDYEVLIDSEHCESSDHGLLVQVTGLVTLSRAFKFFGLEPKRTMNGDDASILNHMRYTEKMRGWRDKWLKLAERHPVSAISKSLTRAVELHYHFSNLVLHSLVLRGRPLTNISSLPPGLRPLALRAIEAAHTILEYFLSDDERPHEDFGSMPLYLHSMIAFAVVFLLKMAPRWHTIGITIDPVQRTIPSVEKIIKLLHGCKAGKSHMVFSMAKGFERMLGEVKRNNIHGSSNNARPSTPRNAAAARQSQTQTRWPSTSIPAPLLQSSNISIHSPDRNNMNSHAGYVPYEPNVSAVPNVFSPAAFAYPAQPALQHDFPTSPGLGFGNGDWSFQDEELWSAGMGYDLLEPGGRGMGGVDFEMQLFS